MPIWLRKYTFNEIKAYYDKEKEEYENARNPNTNKVIDSDGNINVPDFMKNVKSPKSTQPSYVTKASKK